MAKQTKAAPSAKEEPKHTNQEQQQAGAEEVFDWGQHEGATGFEGTRPEDLGIPFLSLLQKGSPEVDEDNPEYETKKIEGAKSGMIINTMTREIVYAKDETQPAQFIPCFHVKLFQEWKPREQGGGFVQSHTSPVILTRCKRNDKNKDILPNGNEIITTDYFSGLLLVQGNTRQDHEDESLRPIRCIIAMSSTQLKKARQWLNMMRAIKINGRTPPMYSHIYNLTSVPESNEKGNWQGWKIEICRPLTMADVSSINECKQIATEMADNQKLLAAPSEAEAPAGETSSSEDTYAEAEGSRRNNR